MKIDFFTELVDKEKNPDVEPDMMIRLFDFDQSEGEELINVVQTHVINNNEQLAFHTIRFVNSTNCNLSFEISATDIGIEPAADKNLYVGFRLKGSKK